MLKGDSATDKTDEDEAEVRKSSRLAENSPIIYTDLFSPLKTPLQCGRETTLEETPGYEPFAPHQHQAQCKEESDSLEKLSDFLMSRDCSPVRYRMRNMLSQAADRTKR